MNNYNYFKRILAIILSVVVGMGTFPIAAIAEEMPSQTNGEIIAFEKLVDEITTQTVVLGTAFEDLNLPKTLKATLRIDLPENNQGNTAQDIEPLENKALDTKYMEMTVSVPVTWTASPAYDSNISGTYIFTPETEDFTVSTELPTITIIVNQAVVSGTISAFDKLMDDIRWQNTTNAKFPAEITGFLENQKISIPVTWEADHEYNFDSPETGLYIFTAKVGDDYILAENIELPRITVYIPVAKRMTRLMAGDGSTTSPLEITTAAQLLEIAVLVNCGKLESFLLGDTTATVSLKLINDLDLSSYGKNWNSGKGWIPIGNTNSNYFKGNFDGNGKKITGLYINRTEQFSGLFGYTVGTVENLGLEDVNITGIGDVGGIAGCISKDNINIGEIKNCYTTGIISGIGLIGGLVGAAIDSNGITDCYSESAVSGTSSNIGGLVGHSKNGNITNCYSTGAVSGKSYIGGLVGTSGKNNITNCYSTGAVSGNTYIGGLAGASDSSITNCYATGAVSGADAIGGLVGKSDSSITNCYATGAVGGADYIGGMVGQSDDGSITNCYSTGSVSGNNYIGGIVGFLIGIHGSMSNTSNCAALNPSISGNSDVGRVVGKIAESPTLSGNIAFSNMTVKLNNIEQTITDGARDNTNGENINASNIMAEGTIGGLFADPSNWIVEHGKLPILQGVGGIQNASLPPYLVAGGCSTYFLGNGTNEAPYQISTAEQLAKLAELVNAGDANYDSKYYKLISDLDLSSYGKNWNSGKGWIPIGNTGSNYFKGNFDGNGKKIMGLYINSTEQFSGLFGYTVGTVENLGLEDVNITGSNQVGGIVGRIAKDNVNIGEIKNCYTTGIISGASYIGGVVGIARDSKDITDCYSESTVNGTGSYIGGVVGSNNCSIINCYSIGAVSGNGYIGGLAGESYDGSITNCYSTGAVSGNIYIGGLVGTSDSSIKNCYATGAVSGNASIGGMVGDSKNSSITNCYATGVVSGDDSIGGLVGQSNNGSITNCAVLNSSISGNVDVGRVIGIVMGSSTLSENIAFSNMTVKLNNIEQTITDGARDNTNGENINASNIMAEGTIGGLFADHSNWIVENGKLPILQGVGGIQNASLPPYLVAGGCSTYFLGNGTNEAPYQISTAEQLAKLAELVNAGDENYNSKYYKLISDLDLSSYGKNWNSGKGWIPIGDTGYKCFKGNFDGNDKKITGLYINRIEQFSGLFGYAVGTVENLGLEDVNITGSADVGGIAGRIAKDNINIGEIKNCYTTGIIGDTSGTSDTSGIGGLVGESVNGSIINCYSTVAVSGDDYIGGLAGNSVDSNITNCYSTGAVSGNAYIGGVLGFSDNSSITNCYATGAVSGDDYIGGMVGESDNSNITNCYATGVVSGDTYIGGMVGASDSSITNCYSTGSVSGNNSIGGLVGFLIGSNGMSNTSNCAALNPSISGNSDLGRVVGKIVGSPTLSGNIAFSNMTVKLNNIEQTITDGARDNTNGENINASNIMAEGTIGGLFVDPSNWIIELGKLPILKDVGGIQNGDGGLYLIARNIAGAIVVVNGNYSYTGNTIIPNLDVTFGGQTLVKNIDYTILITSIDGAGTSAGTNVGTVTLSIKGKGNFSGEKTGVSFNIEKSNDRLAPELKYNISESDFPKTITITEVSGAEYQFNSEGYSQKRTFISNSDETVILNIRLKETEIYKTSPVTTVSVSTTNKTQITPPAFTLTYKSINDESYTVTIPATTGAEYSFDGINWSSENTKTGIKSGDSITAYKRMAAKPGYNASANISDSITLPLFKVKTPTASPNGSTFTVNQIVALDCSTVDAKIYYTTDGSHPTVNSKLYTVPFTVTETTTIKAIAVKTNMTDSEELSITFTKQSNSDNGGGNVSGGGSSAGSGSSTGGSSAIAPVTPETKPIQPINADSIIATLEANGVANVAISDETIKAEIDKAQGKTTNDISIELNITTPKEATALNAVLTRNSLDKLINAGANRLEIKSSIVNISFDKKGLLEIQNKSNSNINITVETNINLSDEAKKIIGTRPIYDIALVYDSGKSLDSLGEGTATVSIPYTLGKNEVVGGLYAVYLDSNGKSTRIEGSAYDEKSGCVIFKTIHFSHYGIAYTELTAKLKDISSHWAKESIDYVVGKGLLVGTSETSFSPNAEMTRGMLVTALGRLAEVETKNYSQNSFTDVKTDSGYHPYIEWAYSKGIIKSVGNKQFVPDRAITREEIAVIFANYAKATGYTLPSSYETESYTDISSVGSTYKNSVKTMRKLGIMVGSSDNKFKPKENATRAEVSTMLSRYIKLIINPETTQG